MKIMNLKLSVFVITAIVINSSALANDQEKLEPWQEAKKSEVWEPVPKVVSAEEGQVPSDAIVLVGKGSQDPWISVKSDTFPWKLENNVLTVTPGTGDIKTKQNFCDVQLHIEWKTPTEVKGMEGQQRNNSGIFFQQRYEIQILDSYNNQTYPNGQAGSVYKQSIPLVNAMRPPGQWQSYDIIFTAPRFEDKELVKPGYITVIHNGVLIQNNVEIQGNTVWIGEPSYKAHGCAPLQLQDHGNLVSFRNVWVRPLGE